MLPCQKLSGDYESPEAEHETPVNAAFIRLMAECTTNFFEAKVKNKTIFEQYNRFRAEKFLLHHFPPLPKLPSDSGKGNTKFAKDRKKFEGKKTVIVGLENILLAAETVPMKDYDHEVEIRQGPIPLGKVYIKFRPYLFDFLEFAARRFELIVYCSGSELYCSAILDCIEASRSYFAYRIYNDHVLHENTSYAVKDYDFLLTAGRTEDNIIIIEYDVAAFCLNIWNGVVVEKFTPDDEIRLGNTKELVELARYLQDLDTKTSVYKVHENAFIKANTFSYVLH